MSSSLAVCGRKAGRPLKHEGGWEKANKRICISNETFGEWRRLREELNLRNDDLVARYLLSFRTTHEQPIERDTNTSLIYGPIPVLSSTPVCKHRLRLVSEDEDSESIVEDNLETLSVIEASHDHGQQESEAATLSVIEASNQWKGDELEVFSELDSDTDERIWEISNMMNEEEFDNSSVDSEEDNRMDDITHESDSGDQCDTEIVEEPDHNPAVGGSDTIVGRVLCSIQKIMELLGTDCRTTGCDRICRFSYFQSGCCLTIQGLCSNGHTFTWHSSDTQVNKKGSRIFEDNLLVASSIVLSGNNFSKLETFFQFLGLKMLSRTTFHTYQRLFICPGITHFYDTEQEKIINSYKGKSVAIAGDGRCDSPGASAKFCTYSMMDIETNKILHMETIDKREVQLQSPNMEREGVVRGISYLHGQDITITELVTDASSSVRKMLAKKHPTIHHSMDIWHKAKKLKKCLAEAGKIKNMEKLLHWSNNIVNHFWYCCRTCDGSVDKLKEKWFSILHHVTNRHEWSTGCCEHESLVGPPTDVDGRELQYFNRQEPSFRALQKLLTDKRWLKSLKFYTKFRHTGILESFHSQLLCYCSKRISFQNQSYQARVQLAILDHNHHCQRDKMKNNKGEYVYHRKYRKQSKKWDVTPVLTPKKYEYIPQLLKVIFAERENSPSNMKLKEALPVEHPGRIQHTIAHVAPSSTSQLISNKKTRFS